jgi:hypothetical protein
LKKFQVKGLGKGLTVKKVDYERKLNFSLPRSQATYTSSTLDGGAGGAQTPLASALGGLSCSIAI